MATASPTTGLAAGTVVARDDLARAHVLADSFARHHPDAPPLTALVLDDPEHEVAESEMAILRPDDLALDPSEFRQNAALAGHDELVAAMKPWTLQALLDRGASTAVYLDPDIEFFGPLAAAVSTPGVVVTPFLTDRDPEDEPESGAWRPGVFDLGFLAVDASARSFLRHWIDRTRRESQRPDTSAPAEPRWVDLAINAFPAHQIRDPGFNVGYWNLHARHIADRDGQLTVDGHPVTFVHFRGFTPEQPYVLAPDAGLAMSERPDLAALYARYAADLRAAGLIPDQPSTYRFARLGGGTPLDHTMRAVYRAELARARGGEAPPPPNPFDGNGDAFLAWLNEPVAPQSQPIVSRYLSQRWRAEDGHTSMYFELVGETAERYLDWCARASDDDIPPSLRPTLDDVRRIRRSRALTRPRGPAPTGVNVVGYLRSASGLGEVGRSFIRALDAAEVPTAVLDRADIPSPRHETLDGEEAQTLNDLLDVNVVCITADQFPRFAREVGPEFFAGRRTAGLWFWEVDAFPSSMLPAIDLADEIWVPSDFVRDAVAPHTTKPVVKVPIPIPCPEPSSEIGRRELQIPEDRFAFAFAFDFLSVAERKNPFGLVDAYTRAFRPDDGACLVIKSINGAQDLAALERLRFIAADRPDVSIMDGYLPAEHQHALFAACDAYVSLHRSEGFGLTIGEAMALGKPVIVTGYSGNLEFTSPENSYLVDWHPTRIGPHQGPYPPEGSWADPDLDHAAHLMRSVFDDPDAARARGLIARDEIRRRWTVDALAPALAAECNAARARAPGSPATWRGFFMRGWRTVQNPEFRRAYEYDWLPDGTPVDESVQRTLHAFLDEARAGHGLPPPNPDRVGGSDAMRDWLNYSISPGLDPCLSRYFVQYWRDHDELRRLFPGIESAPSDAGAFVAWLRESWYEVSDVPYQLAPRPAPAPVPTLERVWTTAQQRARRLLSLR